MSCGHGQRTKKQGQVNETVGLLSGTSCGKLFPALRTTNSGATAPRSCFFQVASSEDTAPPSNFLHYICTTKLPPRSCFPYNNLPVRKKCFARDFLQNARQVYRTSVLCETSSKNHGSSLQNKHFVRGSIS